MKLNNINCNGFPPYPESDIIHEGFYTCASHPSNLPVWVLSLKQKGLFGRALFVLVLLWF